MAANNNLEQESLASTGCKEMVVFSSSNDDRQPMRRGWSSSPNIVYDPEPISWCLPDQQEVCDTVKVAGGRLGGKPIFNPTPLSSAPPKEQVPDNASVKKRKRSEFLGLTEKDFTLRELFRSDNLQEIIQNGETAECTLDSQQILEKLKGWTVATSRRQANIKRKRRIDRVFRHPSSKKQMRSVKQVGKFIVTSSCIKKAADNAEGGSGEKAEAKAEAVGGGCGSSSSVEESLASGKTSNNIYLDIFQRMTDYFKHHGGDGLQFKTTT